MAIFLATIVINFLIPDVRGQEVKSKAVFTVILSLGITVCLFYYIVGYWLKRFFWVNVRTFFDVMMVFAVLFLVWMLIIGKLGLLDPIHWPSPDRAFNVLVMDRGQFGRGIASSMFRLVRGISLGLVLALPLGLIVGWYDRLYRMVYPLAKFIGPIPAVVYIPYALVVFPNVDQVTVFIVFISVFWPVFINMVYGVANVDRRLIDAARTLGGSDWRIVSKVVLPAAMPTAFAGILLGLIMGIVMLTVAETIGAASGIGYYLMYYKDVAAYDRIVADIFVIAACVYFWTYFFDKVQDRTLRWQRGSK